MHSTPGGCAGSIQCDIGCDEIAIDGDEGSALQRGRLLLTGGDCERTFKVAKVESSGESMESDDKSIPGDTTTLS